MRLPTSTCGRGGAWLLALLICTVACHKTSSKPEPEPEPTAAAAAANAPPPEPAAGGAGTKPSPTVKPRGLLTRLPAAERVVAVGDLHGDFLATQDVLKLVGALEDGHWAGEKLVLVQTGDQLDRGDGEKEILDLFEQLKDEAEAAGGRVIALNGNHEIMNALGDYSYVTPDAVDDFDGLHPDSPLKGSVDDLFQERAAAFLPGGSMALRLAERPVVAQVGETIFTHGGLDPDDVRYGLDRLNDEVRQFLRGEADAPSLASADDGPLWSRRYGSPAVDAATCAVLAETLASVGAKRLVIGHTIQNSGISSACDEQVYRIDVAMSSYYGGDKVQALEIRGDEINVLSGKKR
jgi:hypothetical protein